MTYDTLEQAGRPLIHRTFVAAFSDYQVNIEMPFVSFDRMMRRRGFIPRISVGAFDGEKLIGFSLTGLRIYGGILTAYDIATGVVPEYRRQSVTSKVFLRERALLKEKHAEQYLLEVIQTNLPAVQLYTKQGFQIRREFSCFQIDRNRLAQRAQYHAEQSDWMSPEQAKSFWDFEPSWQNSDASVSAVPEAFSSIVVRVGGEAAGYGIIEKKTGDIPQFAVNPKFRRAGVGTSLLVGLTKYTEAEKIRVLNIEAPQEAVPSFLESLGFEYYVRQYEMSLPL